ncbi:hypothetical protein [uncultured Mediterranean phage]|nr:hypothetical protein [uncultured Mediterranean phage]
MEIIDTKNIKDVKVDDRTFRRGYRHGYHQALTDIRSGHKLSKLYTWTKNLLNWNFRHNPFELTIPPMYPEKFKGDDE